jgi:hypothetical protein
MLLLAIAIAVVFAAITRDAQSAAAPPPTDRLDRVSTRGAPFSSLLLRDQRVLNDMGRAGAEISILARSGERAFYRLGKDCYGSGPVSPSEYTFGVIKCSSDFPTAAQPVLDFSIFHSSSGGDAKPSAATLWRSEGIAADGVAKVALVTADGQSIAETAVVDNKYSFSALPAAGGVSLVAYDARGKVVFSEPTG